MTAPRPRRVVAALVVAMTLSAAVSGPAGAAPGDEFRWTVEPDAAAGADPRGQFSYDLAPGQQRDDRVVVTNRSSEPLTFTVYATDASTSTDGAFALPPASQPARDVGAWVDLGRQTRTLRPGERIVLPFRVTVPRNATPGDHAAGIVASVAEQRTDAEGQRVNVERRVGARIYLRVNGPLAPLVDVESVQVSYASPAVPFARGPATITYRLRNPGNVRVAGTARLRITGLFGIPLSGGQDVTLPELLPGARVTLVRRIDGVLPAGMVTATVRVDATSSEGVLPAVTRTGTIWTVPWTLLYLLVVIGAVLALLWWRRRRRRAAGAGTEPADEPVEPAEVGGPDTDPAYDGVGTPLVAGR
ncbi:WxL protein peptidoglycan domain-containing protein [Plantactinospora sp. CA-294935]|uniref:WxL protein peptidoglycan domain-containing protein n=1 Tax=Plantactinospora sp. CA-294935 TaxID=3240012 RepID=UPI003D8F9765